MNVPPPYFPDYRLMVPVTLPTNANKVHHFVNLTNGLEALPLLKSIDVPFHFCRLQSTQCEASRPDLLISAVESGILFQLALGECCLIYDYGSRNKETGASRAIWYGLEFLRYTLRKVWYPEASKSDVAYLRGRNVSRMFDEIIDSFSKATMRQLKYYRQFTSPETTTDVQLYGVYNATTNDADNGYYQKLAREFKDLPTGTRGKELRQALALGIPFDETYTRDVCHPVESVLGMRLFLGGLSQEKYLQFNGMIN